MAFWGTRQAQTGLGGAQEYGKTALPHTDDGSTAVDISSVFAQGITIFGQTYSTLYVNTNGTLSFGQAYSAFPISDNTTPGVPLIAPFWADVDTRLDGEAPESGGIWVDLSTATGLVTITWDDVGVFRRNAEVTNTFQIQLLNIGDGNAEIIFRYDVSNGARALPLVIPAPAPGFRPGHKHRLHARYPC